MKWPWPFSRLPADEPAAGTSFAAGEPPERLTRGIPPDEVDGELVDDNQRLRADVEASLKSTAEAQIARRERERGA